MSQHFAPQKITLEKLKALDFYGNQIKSGASIIIISGQ
jgi:hypothetical protein